MLYSDCDDEKSTNFVRGTVVKGYSREGQDFIRFGFHIVSVIMV
jgi:hypothetical protein